MRKKSGIFMALCTALIFSCITAACGKESSEGNAAPTQVQQEDKTPGTGEGTPSGGQSVKEVNEDENPAQNGAQNVPDAKDSADAADPSATRKIELDENSVKLLGRTQLLLNKNLLCAYSGSGIEFDFTGKHLEVDLLGDSAAREDNEVNCARVAIYVNGERTQDIMLTKKVNTITILDEEKETSARVRIVKLSETAQSVFVIRSIKISGNESIVPTEKKAHAIEFIGDSITCGYGVDDEDASHSFSTKTEDATKAYAYKTAELLDADYSLVSISGYGIISGYTAKPNKKSSDQVMGKYYEKLGNSYTTYNGSIQPQQIGWDFTRFVPEVVVINLGTNDASYCGNDEVKQQEYADGYVEFLKQVRQKNPDAVIVCTLGLMGQDLCKAMDRAVAAYSEETGDDKVHSVWLDVQDTSLGIAANWHPTEANHTKAAETLSAAIREIMGWQ